MDSHNIANTLQNIFRTLIPTPGQNQQPDGTLDDAQGQGQSAATDTTTTASPEAIDTGASSSHTAAPEDDIFDIEMSGLNQSNNNGDDDEMPELQSVSDSDSENEDLDEVEMQAHYDDQADLNAFINGSGGDRLMSNLQSRTQHLSQTSANPASTSSSSLSRPNRRARVDDDDDEERDRRHPSERVNAPRVGVPNPTTSLPALDAAPANPVSPPSNEIPPPQSQSQTQQPRTQAPFPELFSTFLQEFRRRAADQRQNQGQPNAQAPTAPQQNRGAQGTGALSNLFGDEGGQGGGFAITFDLVNGSEPVVTRTTTIPPWVAAMQNDANAGNGGNGNNGRGPPGSRSNPIALDADALFNFINMLNIFPGIGPEVEDPERAKLLVDALEEVPIGLIRRMERVSEGVDLSGSGGEVNCAICWDRLLDSDGGSGWAKKDEEHGHGHNEVDPVSDEPSSTEDSAPPTSDDVPASTSSESSEPNQPKIVSLPCAHVFHAACLIPWFSRPKQTTCPACRFNIDPENLTYRPQARRRAANAPRAPTTNVATDAATQAGTDIQQQAQGPSATANAGVQTPDAEPTNDRESLAQTVETLETMRNALSRRIDEVEAHERDLVARLMAGTAEVDDLNDDPQVTRIEIPQTGSDAVAPSASSPDTPVDHGTPTTANDSAEPPGEPRDLLAGVVTIGFDVIIGTNSPNGDDFLMDDGDIDQAQTPTQEQPRAQGQEPNIRRFGAPFGAGLRTGAARHGQLVGIGRTFNEALASLVANNNPTNNTPAANPTAPRPPVAFGPPPPPPAPQAQPGIGLGQTNTIPRNNGRNGPTSDTFNIGQIFNRLFGGIGGQREGQGQGTSLPAEQQPRAQGTPTQLPPFLNTATTSALPTPATQPAPVPGTANTNTRPTNTNLPPLQQHFANMFGGVPGFPPGGVFVGRNGTGNPGEAGTTGPRPASGGFDPAFWRQPLGQPRGQPFERRKWALPAPPGPTLRQRIEKAEREAGLRCFDISCGVGPSDEEPLTTLTDATKKQLSIQDADRHDGTPHQNVCTHTFHPACLVSAARVALMGEDATLVDDGLRVGVACSVCRSEGSVLKNDWDEGVDALK